MARTLSKVLAALAAAALVSPLTGCSLLGAPDAKTSVGPALEKLAERAGTKEVVLAKFQVDKDGKAGPTSANFVVGRDVVMYSDSKYQQDPVPGQQGYPTQKFDLARVDVPSIVDRVRPFAQENCTEPKQSALVQVGLLHDGSQLVSMNCTGASAKAAFEIDGKRWDLPGQDVLAETTRFIALLREHGFTDVSMFQISRAEGSLTFIAAKPQYEKIYPLGAGMGCSPGIATKGATADQAGYLQAVCIMEAPVVPARVDLKEVRPDVVQRFMASAGDKGSMTLGRNMVKPQLGAMWAVAPAPNGAGWLGLDGNAAPVG